MDMICFDRGFTKSCGGEPCGLGQEIEGSWVALAGFGEQIGGGLGEDVAIQAGAAQMPAQVGSDVLAGQGLELVGGTDAGEQGALDGETQAAQQIVVAQKDEAEGGALARPQPQKHADFLQDESGVVLGVVEDEQQGERVNVGEMFFKDQQIGASLEAGMFSEFGEEDFEHAGGRERGLGNEQTDAEIGADDFGVRVDERPALVGVEFERQAAAQDGLLEAVQEGGGIARQVVGGERNKPAVVVEDDAKLTSKRRSARRSLLLGVSFFMRRES